MTPEGWEPGRILTLRGMDNLVKEEAKSKRESLSARPRSPRPDSRKPALSEAEGRLSLCDHCLSHDLGELPDIFFRCVERAHPADDGFLFDPHVEKVALLNLGDGMGRDFREDPVGFHLPDNLYSWDPADFFFEQPRHAICVLSTAMPEIVGQQRLELCGDETHL